MLDVGRHPNIELMAYSEVEKVEGEAGDFKVSIRRKARYVDEDKCTGCGACTEKCPTLLPDAFNMGLGERKAIYSWFAQGIPSTHTIDAENCRQLQGKKCGICKKTCQADAVNFEQEDRIVELNVGAIIVASGYEVFDASRVPEYRYRGIPNVITALEFERLLSASGPTGGHLDRPSDIAAKAEIGALEKKAKKARKTLEKFEEKFGEASSEFFKRYEGGEYGGDEDRKKWAERYAEYLAVAEPLEALKEKAKGFTVAKNLAFIQCVGSRDMRFYPFCSGYCCMHSIKEAIIAYEHEPETRSVIFGMDIRAVGKGFEEYKIRGGNQAGISYVRGRVAEITEGPDRSPVLTYEDTLERVVKSEAFDLVILATACAPSKGISALAKILGIELDEFGFYKADKLNPMDTTRPGIFTCGCAHSPMDIPESVAQASGAAARAAQIVLESERRKAS
jgi:heterodisulfide reductase subunit A-like polyferredoxin